MGFAATMVWEIRAAGSNANGGGFDPTSGVPGTDYSQQAAAQVAYTDLVIDGATNTDCTSAANPFTAAHVGNIVNVTGGTGFTVQRVQIMSVMAGVARMDKSLGTLASTGGTGNLGGAIASPGLVSSLMVAGNDTYQKSDGVYTITSATANILGGCVSLPAGASASNQTRWFGYQTTRGDGGTKPIIRADGVITTFVLFTTAAGNWVENIEVDGNSRTSSRGFSLSSSSAVYKCRGRNCTNSAFSASAGSVFLCEATGCATQAAFAVGAAFGCVAYSNTITGFSLGSGGLIVGCLAVNNTSGYGFFASAGGSFTNCTAYNNSLDGFRMNANNLSNICTNCLAVNNSAYGFNGSAVHNGAILINCAGYNNTSGNVNSTNIPAAQQIGFLALSGSPFNNAAGGDFSLNMTAGAGNDCRQGGIPGAFPGVSTTGYPDIGCVQEGGVRVADITAIQAAVAAGAVASVTGSVGSVASGGITAASIATGAIDADALATDAVAEIADGVWDESYAGHLLAGTYGAFFIDMSTFITDMSGVISEITAKLGAFTTTGVNTVLGFFRALMRKDGSITTPSDVGGAYDHTTDSTEAIRDNQSSGGGPTMS